MAAMIDRCVLCVDDLDWVAYGVCGHQDVCSACVARRRFICQDHCCSSCLIESDHVFVTKSLGNFTKMVEIKDLPSEPKEGLTPCGTYWYHEDTKAFFDDGDHYKKIKALCALSCSQCDKEEAKSGAQFQTVQQLMRHLFYEHKLFMCHLCLRAKKMYVCEQKLYTSEQLRWHISLGGSIIDGGSDDFRGHPQCEFCGARFYGEIELYEHIKYDHHKRQLCFNFGQNTEYHREYKDIEAPLDYNADEDSWEMLGDDSSDNIDQIIKQFESSRRLASDSSRYLEVAVGVRKSEGVAKTQLQDNSLFPPLAACSSDTASKPEPARANSNNNTMAAHLRRQGKRNVASERPCTKAPFVTRDEDWPRAGGEVIATSQIWPKPRRVTHPSKSYAYQVANKVSRQTKEPPSVVSDLQSANMSLQDNIRSALGYEESAYEAFMDIYVQYRRGLVESKVYYDLVRQFGLSHLVLDLARMSPNTQKQKELINAYNGSMRSNVADYDDDGEEWLENKIRLKNSKGKGKNSKKGLMASTL